MTFPRGERIQRPSGTGPSWWLTAISQVRREAHGEVPVKFELAGGPEVEGVLDQPNTVVGPLGTVVLAGGTQVAAAEIEAFTLLPDPEPGD